MTALHTSSATTPETAPTAPGTRTAGAPRIARAVRSIDPVAAAVAAVAMAVTAAFTRGGALITGDSATYLKTARLVADDPLRIFSPPVGTDLSIRALFPPLYPTVLAVGGGTESWARWVGVAAAGVTAYVVVRVVTAHSSAAGALLAALVMLANRGTIPLHFGFVLSDGLHLMFVVTAVAVATLTLTTDDPRSARRWTAAAALLGAGALLTRYAGLAAVLSVALTVGWFAGDRSWRDARRAGACLVVGTLPLALWTLAISRSGEVGRRGISYHPIPANLGGFFTTLPRCFLPGPALDALGTTGLTVVGVAAALAALVWSVRRVAVASRPTSSSAERAAASFAAAAWIYAGVMIGTASLLDRQVGLGGRYAIPWLALMAGAVGISVDRHLRRDAPSPRRRQAGWVAIAVATVVSSVGLARAVADPVGSWWNYGQLPPSSLVASLDGVPRSTLVYTNQEDLVYLATGRPTARIPRRLDLYTFRPNPRFRSDLAAIADDVRRGRAVLLVWEGDPWGMSVPEVRRLTGLDVVRRVDDGALLAAPDDS